MNTPPIRKITIQQNVRKAGGGGNLSRLFRRLRGMLGSKDRPPAKKVLSYVAIVAVALILAGGIASVGLIAWVAGDLPDPNNLIARNVPQTTKIYDRTGERVLYEVHGDQKRTVVELADISPHVVHATIAAEDKDFYTHSGFSLTGYARAFYKNLITRERGQGGSTITQQFVKNAVLSPEKTYTRKLKELVLAFEIERRFSKDDILKLYLNEIPYGPVIYGVQSAAESFFGKDAKDLTISESAMITAVANATTYYSPYGNHTDELLSRTRWIVDRMREEEYITAEEAEDAKADDPLERLMPQNATILAPHFVFYVKELLAEEFGEQLVERGGLRVITSLDADLQATAEEAVTEHMEFAQSLGASTAALMSFDPKNGDILAMVGSADYFNDDINGKYNALRGRLQPGSSIKPMVYASAFERGFTPDTVVYDVKTDFNGYSPNNYDLSEHGPVTLREALAGSLNIPAVKVLYLAGIDNFVDFAKKVGYTTLSDRDRFGLSVVLGGADVRPMEHFNAFGALANDGVLTPVRGVLRVENDKGEVLLDVSDEKAGKRVMETEIARQVTSILSDNAARAFVFGENNYLTLGGRPVAAKTGTTNDYKDAWTVGYTPSLVTGVWVGNADATRMKAGASGGRIAAPLWNAFMRKALDGSAVEGFPTAEPVVTGKPVLDGEKQAQVMVKIDSVSGKLATDRTPPELVVEKGFGEPHSILFFVDRKDPRGPVPEDPSADPMFDAWEKGVAEWTASQGIVLSTEPPPTSYDDIHIAENIPSVAFRSPRDGETVTSRYVAVNMDASARRGVLKVTFSINGDEFDRLTAPFAGTITIPNRFGIGFHTLTATAYDDVGNRAETSVTVNLAADPLPLGVRWTSPRNNDVIFASQFPYSLRFTVDDLASISSLELLARGEGNGDERIGVIHDPALPNMAMQWKDAPQAGTYDLDLVADLKEGGSITETIRVHVR